jgi:hypothetical protein
LAKEFTDAFALPSSDDKIQTITQWYLRAGVRDSAHKMQNDYFEKAIGILESDNIPDTGLLIEFFRTLIQRDH